jgi:hypothetical protein
VTSFPKTNSEAACLAFWPKAWPFSRQSDAAEADTFRVLIVQDFDSVAVEDGDDGSGEVPREYGWAGANEEASPGYRETQQSASTGASTQHPIDSENDAESTVP